jgi:hypothetical protein
MKAAKQAHIQLQNDIKYASKGMEKVKNLTAEKKKKDSTTKIEEDVEEAPIPVTSRGRQIRLPQGFREDKKLAI